MNNIVNYCTLSYEINGIKTDSKSNTLELYEVVPFMHLSTSLDGNLQLQNSSHHTLLQFKIEVDGKVIKQKERISPLETFVFSPSLIKGKNIVVEYHFYKNQKLQTVYIFDPTFLLQRMRSPEKST